MNTHTSSKLLVCLSQGRNRTGLRGGLQGKASQQACSRFSPQAVSTVYISSHTPSLTALLVSQRSTCRHLAAKAGHAEACAVLLDKSDEDAENSEDGNTPL